MDNLLLKKQEEINLYDSVVKERADKELLHYKKNQLIHIKKDIQNKQKLLYERAQEESDEYLFQISLLQTELENLERARNSAVESYKREEEIKRQKDFYRLVLSEEDLEDVRRLKTIEQFLHNKEILNKLVYKVYYEKPFTSMIGRLIGSSIKIGIYKITNLENQMCYIGQAVNISERWKSHVKRALGAEPITQNKLYPEMAKVGVENFSFEIIEECERSQLTSREQYWIDFYKSKSYGYNMKN